MRYEAIILLLALAPTLTPAPHTACPTYNTVLSVTAAATPRTTRVGITVTIIVHAQYPERTPAALEGSAAITWSGAAGQAQTIAPLIETAPGTYALHQRITPDLTDKIGYGTATLSIIPCSIGDKYGNNGPNQPTTTTITILPTTSSTTNP